METKNSGMPKIKGQTVIILGFVGHIDSVATTQLSCLSSKATIDKV